MGRISNVRVVFIPIGRPLRNDGQRQRFADAQASGRLAEVDAARGADALDVAAERHEVQVRLEQLALRVARFEPECRRDLAGLAGRRLDVPLVPS